MKTTLLIVGAGGFARRHLRQILSESRGAPVAGIVEVSREQRDLTRALFAELGRPAPPFHDRIGDFLAAGGRADAALIATPHTLHGPQAEACLAAGMDVLLEKPMVMTAAAARRLIRARDRAGRTLVVAVPGAFAPLMRRARAMIRGGRIGRLTSIHGWLHEAWKERNRGTWRQDPSLSGGGYLFDTGAHLMHATLELAGEDVAEVRATLDNAGTPVDVVGTVAGRFHGGAAFAWHVNGDAAHWGSRLWIVGDRGTIETDAWGGTLRWRAAADAAWREVPAPRRPSIWKTFLAVRAGRAQNPCPAETGLRIARLMDAVRRSAAAGQVVRIRGRPTGNR